MSRWNLDFYRDILCDRCLMRKVMKLEEEEKERKEKGKDNADI